MEVEVGQIWFLKQSKAYFLVERLSHPFVEGKYFNQEYSVVKTTIENYGSTILLNLESLKNDEILIKPPIITIGQVYLWAKYAGKAIVNWEEENFKIRIKNISDSGDILGVVHSFSRPKDFSYGSEVCWSKNCYQVDANVRLISPGPKCFYCLCPNNENYLPSLNKLPIICKACRQ